MRADSLIARNIVLALWKLLPVSGNLIGEGRNDLFDAAGDVFRIALLLE